jgi:MerR family transcriptional regulator/heat shock protein HspR
MDTHGLDFTEISRTLGGAGGGSATDWSLISQLLLLHEDQMKTGKKPEVQPISPETPVYSIGVAAQLLDVHPRTLRIYEDEGLIKPSRKGNRRFFSQNDLIWINCIRKMIHEEGISIPGIKKLLRYAPCWEIANCPPEVCTGCTAQIDVAVPRTLRIAGDREAERRAKEREVAARRKAEQERANRSKTN